MKCSKCGEEMKLISDNINDGSAYTCEKCGFSTWIAHSYKASKLPSKNDIEPIIRKYHIPFSEEFKEDLINFFKNELLIVPYKKDVDSEGKRIKIYLCDKEIADVDLSFE